MNMSRVVVAILAIGLTIYAFIDCLQTPQPRTLPKIVWLFIIVLVPILGPVLWIFFGRIHGGGWGRDDDGPMAPDDDPNFLRDLDRLR